MTPEQFSHDAGAWIAAMAGLLIPLTAFVGGIFGFVAFAKGRLNELRINGHSQTLKEVLRDLPPAGQTGGVQINAEPPSSINVTNDASPAQTPVTANPSASTGAPEPLPDAVTDAPPAGETT